MVRYNRCRLLSLHGAQWLFSDSQVSELPSFRAMARGAATAIPLTSALLPCQKGFPGARKSTRRLQWRKRENSLEPYMSRETLEYHWGRHHRGYVENLNRQILGTELDGLNLEDIIITSYNKGDVLPAFNNAAQIWNHEFFWESMKPGGAGKPSGDLLELIERDFCSYEKFINEFKSAASTQFGSGWVWLAYKANRLDVGNAVNPCPSEEDKRLVVVKSPNAVNPLVWDYLPLLAIDVWEHAYYLDYLNCRDDYISVFMDHLVSWEVVSSRFEMAKARVAEREREEIRRKVEEEENFLDSEAVEVYLDSESEDSEVE
ncbi:superoxide dismutase [Fe], chloroplastic isoform X2 [Macadamia integrifolia]|uniref:superoxide dismutase [Fe], chloroplastic isoform X2 n=1 Tax=Macadamia integrifolia TaxID=60698 RepID=UPI001C4F369B|nr:superoxide dismutase [Fe], chloroplastic isoform X2 [Macadamia integrifolia]